MSSRLFLMVLQGLEAQLHQDFFRLRHVAAVELIDDVAVNALVLRSLTDFFQVMR